MCTKCGCSDVSYGSRIIVALVEVTMVNKFVVVVMVVVVYVVLVLLYGYYSSLL